MAAEQPISEDATGESDTQSCVGWRNDTCRGTSHCPARCPRYFDSTGAPILITSMHDVDLNALVSMYETIESSTMGLPPDSRDEIGQWLSHLSETGWNLVAVSNDRVIGHIAVAPADVPDPKFVVFVHDEYHEQGIGTELVKQSIAHAAEKGYEALKLSVSGQNRRAIAVYTNVGFDIINQDDVDLKMRLPLDEPIATEVRRPPAERSS